MSDQPAASPALALTALVVASAIVGSIALVGTSAVAQDEASVSFSGEKSFQTAIGDPIRGQYTIHLENTQYATIVLRRAPSANGSYWGNLTVKDNDGNGFVNVSINTWEMGHAMPWGVESGNVTAWDGEEVPDGQLVSKTKEFDSDAYHLLVGPGQSPTAVLESPSDTGRLRVEEGETEDPDVVTAPRGAELERMTDIYQQPPGPFADPKEGLSEEGDTVIAEGDTLALLPFGGGFYGAAEHAIEEEPDREAALQWLLAEGYYEMSFAQNGSNPKVLNVDEAIAQDALQFDSSAPYYHLMFAIDMSAEVFQVNGEGEFVAPEAGEVYTFSIAKAGRVDADGDPAFLRTKRVNISVVEAMTEITTPVASLNNDRLHGETTLAPGTTLTVYAGTTDDTQEFETTVDRGVGEGEFHMWNVSTTMEGYDSSDVDVAVWNEHHGRIGAFPPDTGIGPAPATTTSGPGEGTTTSGDDGTTQDPDGTDTTAPSDGDGGDGGMIPGFTASIALVAILAAALLAFRRD